MSDLASRILSEAFAAFGGNFGTRCVLKDRRGAIGRGSFGRVAISLQYLVEFLVPVSALVSLMICVISSSLQQLRDFVVSACGTQKSTMPVKSCSILSPTEMANLREIMKSLP